MTKFLLSLHVLAAILTVGPITVAASMFPRCARTPAGGDDGPGEGDGRTAAFLHRICRGYTVVGLALPVFGVATGAQLGVLTDAWLLASVGLTAVAAALLLIVILPGQQRLLALPADEVPDGVVAVEMMRASAARLSMTTGIFDLLWTAVVVLMIVRPGSATGA